MNKVIKYTLAFAATVIVAGILFLTIFSGVRLYKGESLTAYNRFHKVENGKEKFNFLGLLSPLQVESQKQVNDTVHFMHTVVYPLAPHFKVVAPDDTTVSEAFVANEIARVVMDTINKRKFNLAFDYDHQALAVRASQHIALRPLIEPYVRMSLHGTASPEAGKYGFYQSIKPGVIEHENEVLAAERVARTTELLVDDLIKLGITCVTVSKVTSEELQFSETDMVDSATAVGMLPGMRYVRATIDISMQHTEVTPVTVPIAFPLWLALLSLLLFLFWPTEKAKALQSVQAIEPIDAMPSPKVSYYDENSWWIIFVIICIVVLAFLAALIYFFGMYLLYFILFCVAIYIIDVLFYFLRRRCGDWFTKKRTYWSTKPVSCKVVVILLAFYIVATLVLLVTYLLGYWHICF